MIEIPLKYKKTDINKLISFGFTEENGKYTYCEMLDSIGMTACVTVKDGRLFTELSDSFSGEEYVLHKVPSAAGTFVGAVREAHDSLVDRIMSHCCYTDIFKLPQSKEIIEYVRQKYSHELEHLWEDTPENAVWRRGDNNRWYAALLTVKKEKLGIAGEGTAEVINLKAPPETVTELLSVNGIFPAYHMNKKHWYSVVLDGTLSTDYVCSLIDKSYSCVKSGRRHS